MDESGNSLKQPAGIDWGAEMQRHGRWLRAVLLARSRERGAVEELFQEVALIAVQQGDSLRDTDRIAPWLYQIAVRAALMFRRRMGRQRRLRESFAFSRRAQTRQDATPDPLEWLLADERSQRIREAIECLPGKDAEVLMLKYSEGWTYREIAEHLGLTDKAVDARLQRARRRLRTRLAQLDVIELPRLSGVSS